MRSAAALHYRYTFAWDPYNRAAKQAFRGSTTNTVASLRDGLDAVNLHCAKELRVERCEIDGKEATFTRDGDVLKIAASPPLAKGKPVTVTFYYDGRLSGQEDSPVYGIKFAAIQNDYAYLMYPARWFPISGYSTDRYSAEINVSVAKGFKPLGSGIDTAQSSADKTTYNFKFERASFPGSIAVVKDAPATRVSSEGVTTALYFRPAEQPMANAYGQETGKIVTHFTGLFGLAPYANLTIVETEAVTLKGAPDVKLKIPPSCQRSVNRLIQPGALPSRGRPGPKGSLRKLRT